MSKRVSVLNFVSRELDMFKLSTKSALENAGTDNFDYIVTTWNATPEVLDYIKATPRIIHRLYTTDDSIGFVPNLRKMMNEAFDYGYTMNDWCSLTNSDVYHGRGWLLGLMQFQTENHIVNSTHLTPLNAPQWVWADLGMPTEEGFNFKGFDVLYKTLHANDVYTQYDLGGWGNCSTMPYLVHRKWWEKCGPWELHARTHGVERAPDRRFFQRCAQEGAFFTKSRASIIYHYEAAERSKGPPKGAEHLRKEI